MEDVSFQLPIGMFFLSPQPFLDISDIFNYSNAAPAIAIFSRFHDPYIFQVGLFFRYSFVLLEKGLKSWRVLTGSDVVGLGEG